MVSTEECGCCTLDECIDDYSNDPAAYTAARRLAAVDSGFDVVSSVPSNVGMVFAAATTVVALVAVYAAASAAGTVRLAVDDGKLWSALVMGVLLIDFYSDIAFVVHLKAQFAANSEENTFYTLMMVAAAFIIVSYLANIASMVTILLRVLEVSHL